MKVNIKDIFGCSKKQLEDRANEEVSYLIEEGLFDLKTYLECKAIKEYSEFALTAMREAAVEAFESYGEKKVEIYGFTLEKVESGVKYDYSNCGSEAYNILSERRKEIDKEMKNIEKELKLIKADISVLDEDSGEVTRKRPPVKKSTTTLKVGIS